MEEEPSWEIYLNGRATIKKTLLTCSQCRMFAVGRNTGRRMERLACGYSRKRRFRERHLDKLSVGGVEGNAKILYGQSLSPLRAALLEGVVIQSPSNQSEIDVNVGQDDIVNSVPPLTGQAKSRIF